jgi:hypothetical protein
MEIIFSDNCDSSKEYTAKSWKIATLRLAELEPIAALKTFFVLINLAFPKILFKAYFHNSPKLNSNLKQVRHLKVKVVLEDH